MELEETMVKIAILGHISFCYIICLVFYYLCLRQQLQRRPLRIFSVVVKCLNSLNLIYINVSCFDDTSLTFLEAIHVI